MTPLFVARHRATPPALVAAATLAAGLLVGLAGCHEAAPSAAAAGPPPLTPVQVDVVASQPVSATEELSGRIEAVQQVEVRARVSGTVTAVHYRDGADVAANAPLFTIDARPYRATLSRAQATLASLEARVGFARSQATTAETLLASGAITRVERDELATTATQSGADVQAARAAVALARLDVDFTQVRAPIAGRTGDAAVSVGDYVAAGPAPTQLTTLVSLDPVYVYFTGDEQTFLRLGSRVQGAAVTVGLADEPGFPHHGTIDYVDSRVDAATGTIRLRASLPNPDHRLTPGLYARVRLTAAAPAPALVIADRAIMTDQDRKYVYVVGAGDAVERRDLKLGRVVDGQRVVTSGLVVGDRVVTTNTQKVGPGAHVAVLPAAATPASFATPVAAAALAGSAGLAATAGSAVTP